MLDFSSIVLRFRDLSNPVGTTTISEHQRIISDKGYVCWGWWKKQGETVPENAFRQILAQVAKSGRYEIFLFDTGNYKLYRAKLTDIKWDKKLTPVATPDRAATPNYYGDAHYLAWFKLESIDSPDIPESELQKWSYVRNDEFFEAKRSAFNEFYDKQVSSFKELRNQDRTVWFIRPKRGADKVHEIHVHDRSRIAPSNFSEQVVELHTPNPLWISDPHFSEDHHDFPRRPHTSRLNLSEAVRRDLESIKKKDIGGLLISGDLTWRGAKEEYAWAAEFIGDVTSWARLTANHVLVCPGNHDLVFSNEPWTKGTLAAEATEKSVSEYKRFYEQLFEVKPSDDLSCGRRFWVPDGAMVDIASLNSSLLQQIPGAFQGQGYVGGTQLRETAKSMMWSGDRFRTKALRVCMLHHHIVPILHREQPEIGVAASVVHDAGALMRWLVENEVDLVLHGHMHLPSLIKESRALDYPKQEKWHDITVAALGSSGVVISHRPPSHPHTSYGLIEFLREGALITVRKISADDAIPSDQREVYSAMLRYK
jgi:calcineurin-like phosphoesterase family protein